MANGRVGCIVCYLYGIGGIMNTILVMKTGDLFYWKRRVLCEYIGVAKDGRYMFKTTNGGIIYIYPDRLAKDISTE